MEYENFDSRVNNYITVLPEPSGGAWYQQVINRLKWAADSLKFATKIEAIQFFKDHNINGRLQNDTMGWIIDTRQDDWANALTQVAAKIPVIGQVYQGLKQGITPDIGKTGIDLALINQIPTSQQLNQQIISQNPSTNKRSFWDELIYRFKHLEKFPK